MSTTTNANQPADRVSIGVIHAAIWRNTDPEERSRYSVTLDRGYRIGEGE